MLRGLAADFIITDAKARHVDAHIGGRLVGRGPHDLLKQATKDGEGLDIAVVVDRRFTMSLQVEVVNHVDVIQVHGGRLVGDIYGVIQRKIPDREGLKLCVSRGHSALVIVVELGQAGCKLA